MSPDKDALYWALRLENEDFLRRRYWWGFHFANGSLVSQRRRAANKLGQEGEAVAIQLIEALGYHAFHTTRNCEYDLLVRDGLGAVRVEVKASLYDEGQGRYEANIRQHAGTDLVLFLAKNGSWWPYIIPIGAVGRRHNIAIWSRCPGNYKGQWQIYLEAWGHLEQAIRNAQPRAWQLSLPAPLPARRN